MCLHSLEISSLSGAQGPYGVLGGVSLQGGIRSASCRGSLSPAKALGKLDKATGKKVLPGHELTPHSLIFSATGPMVPPNPSQVRGGPENTHQGGAGGWENLQVVCVRPQQEAGERPVSPFPLIYDSCGWGRYMLPRNSHPRRSSFSHTHLRDNKGDWWGGILSGQRHSQP